MFNRDTLISGILVSVVLTVAVWLGLDTLSNSYTNKTVFGLPFGGLSESFKATMAVFSNILPFIVYMRSGRDNALRGVGIVTVLLALFVAVYFFLM